MKHHQDKLLRTFKRHRRIPVSLRHSFITDSSLGWLMNGLVDSSLGWLMNGLVDSSLGWLMNGLVDSSLGWFMNWLVS